MNRVIEHSLRPFKGLLSDEGTTDIVVNRPGEIGVETNGKWVWHAEPFLTYERLEALAITAAYADGQDISSETPLCSMSLPDGERLEVCIPPATAKGTISLSIRRPPSWRPRLATMGALFEETGRKALEAIIPVTAHVDRLRQAVLARKNILIAGATGSGKTTLAKALIEEIPLRSRLITIEDTFEWKNIPHRNRVALRYSKGSQSAARGVTAERLIETSLRMRPDRVLMQELRDSAALAFLRGACAGHPGAITTLHADSATGAFDALRLMLGTSISEKEKDLLMKYIHVIAHCERDEETKVFRVTEVWP